MNNKYIISEIKKWEEEKIISSEQATLLTSKYSDSQQKNSYIVIFAVIGALFVGIGSIAIITSTWQYIPQKIQSVIAFLPLIFAYIFTAFLILKKNNSQILIEIAGTLYSVSVFSTYKLTEIIYNTPTDYIRYIFCCGIMLLPIVFILKSCVTTSVYIFAITNWGYLVAENANGSFSAYFFFAMTCFLVFVGLIYLNKKSNKEIMFINILITWISAVAVFSLLLIFTILTKGDIALTLTLLFSGLLLLGKENTNIYSPFVSAGTTGFYVMMFLFSGGVVSSLPEKNTLITVIYPIALLTAVIIAFFAGNKQSAKRIIFLLDSIAVTVLCLISTFISASSDLPDFATTLISIFFMVTGIIFLANGAKNNKLSDINLGIISLCLVIFSFISESINSFEKGIFIFILGLFFLSINIIIAKKNKSKNMNTEEIVYEE